MSTRTDPPAATLLMKPLTWAKEGPHMMRFPIIASFLLALSVAGCANQPAAKTFHVDLAGSHEVPPVNSPGRGAADLTFDPTSKQLTWKIVYSGLTSDAMGAHIHGPARPGDNAGVLINLAPNGMRSPLEGSATLTGEQVDYLMLARCYINIHTPQHKEGEIRGQITP